MSLYGDYIKEHRGDEMLEYDEGFATYRYLNDGKSVYIVDIYVSPGKRQSYLATIMADDIVKIAKEKGATELFGSVVPYGNNATASLKVLLAYGFSLKSASPELIVFRKDI